MWNLKKKRSGVYTPLGRGQATSADPTPRHFVIGPSPQKNPLCTTDSVLTTFWIAVTPLLALYRLHQKWEGRSYKKLLRVTSYSGAVEQTHSQEPAARRYAHFYFLTSYTHRAELFALEHQRTSVYFTFAETWCGRVKPSTWKNAKLCISSRVK